MASQTSVVVVEIDTRKGPIKTVFESAIQNQSEQAKVIIWFCNYFNIILIHLSILKAILENIKFKSSYWKFIVFKRNSPAS